MQRREFIGALIGTLVGIPGSKFYAQEAKEPIEDQSLLTDLYFGRMSVQSLVSLVQTECGWIQGARYMTHFRRGNGDLEIKFRNVAMLRQMWYLGSAMVAPDGRAVIKPYAQRLLVMNGDSLRITHGIKAT